MAGRRARWAGPASSAPHRCEAPRLALQPVPHAAQQAAHALPVAASGLVPENLHDPAAVEPEESEMTAVDRSADLAEITQLVAEDVIEVQVAELRRRCLADVIDLEMLEILRRAPETVHALEVAQLLFVEEVLVGEEAVLRQCAAAQLQAAAMQDADP